MPDEVMVLFLESAGRLFAVETGQVETLRRKETLYPVQEGLPGLLGFLPLGGQVLPVVDLAVCLGLAGSAIQPGRMLVVSSLREAPLAFRVERVAGPQVVAWEDLALLPEMLRALQVRQTVWGLVRRGDELVPLLDLGRVLSPDEVATLLELACRVEWQG